MKGERTVAGISCGTVLSELSQYLDGELAAERRTQLEGHVKACDTCSRMGGEVGAMVSALRKTLGAEPMPEDAAARLDDVLSRL